MLIALLLDKLVINKATQKLIVVYVNEPWFSQLIITDI